MSKRIIIRYKNLKTIYIAGLVGVSTIFFISVINFGIKWSEAAGSFNLRERDVRGEKIIGKDEVHELADLPIAKSLNEINLKKIQERIEEHSYIRAARVSRRFPNKIVIDIIERKPLAYINLPSPSFLLVDEQGFVMPLRHGDMEFEVPTLTGFNIDPELYPIGSKCLSLKTIEAIEYLNNLRKLFPSLFDNLSELTVDKNDEYVMVLSEYPTRIHLGQSNILDQLALLKNFNDTILGLKSLNNYTYVDLRYKNQIIVREKT
ncbi:MAG: cell division protein FtsQ/DivIB [Candidatus Neomarinimicrobiota bacterium]